MIQTHFMSALLRVAAGVALATALTVPALAQGGDAGAKADPEDWAQRFMALVDTEHKGYITPEDAERYVAERFERLDRGDRGYIDEAAFVAPLQRVLDRADETEKPRLAQALQRREAAFKMLDPQGTGKVTRDAYLAEARAHYVALDVKKDGKVTLDELRQAHHGF